MNTLVENIEIFLGGYAVIVFLNVASFLKTINDSSPKILLYALSENASTILTSSMLESFFILGFLVLAMGILYVTLGIMELVINIREQKKVNKVPNEEE